MPPSEPPTTRSSRSMPSASSSRHWASAWSRVETAGKVAPYGRPGPRVERGRSGRAVAAAEQIRGEDADLVVSSARPGPMSGSHQSPAASAEPVRAWMTSTCGAVAGAGPSCR